MARKDQSAGEKTAEGEALRRPDLPAEPHILLLAWLEAAKAAGLTDANAFCLASVDTHSQPWQRHVLMKSVDAEGLVFFTNYTSLKAGQIQFCPRVSALFPWLGLHRQVSIHGLAERIRSDESAEYFATRPRGSQLGAWASPQSAELSGRDELLANYKEAEDRFAGKDVPCPDHWGGYRLTPHRYEFWQGRRNRLHDRLVYEQQESKAWRTLRLAP